jgi:hypothetical protein
MAHVTIWQVVSMRLMLLIYAYKPQRSGVSIFPAPLPGHLLRTGPTARSMPATTTIP